MQKCNTGTRWICKNVIQAHAGYAHAGYAHAGYAHAGYTLDWIFIWIIAALCCTVLYGRHYIDTLHTVF